MSYEQAPNPRKGDHPVKRIVKPTPGGGKRKKQQIIDAVHNVKAHYQQQFGHGAGPSSTPGQRNHRYGR